MFYRCKAGLFFSHQYLYVISGRPLSKQQSRKGAKSSPALLIHTNRQTHLRTRSSSCIENICLLRECMVARCTASFKIHLPLLRQHVQAPRCFFSTGPRQMICFRFLTIIVNSKLANDEFILSSPRNTTQYNRGRQGSKCATKYLVVSASVTSYMSTRHCLGVW